MGSLLDLLITTYGSAHGFSKGVRGFSSFSNRQPRKERSGNERVTEHHVESVFSSSNLSVFVKNIIAPPCEALVVGDGACQKDLMRLNKDSRQGVNLGIYRVPADREQNILVSAPMQKRYVQCYCKVIGHDAPKGPNETYMKVGGAVRCHCVLVEFIEFLRTTEKRTLFQRQQKPDAPKLAAYVVGYDGKISKVC